MQELKRTSDTVLFLDPSAMLMKQGQIETMYHAKEQSVFLFGWAGSPVGVMKKNNSNNNKMMMMCFAYYYVYFW